MNQSSIDLSTFSMHFAVRISNSATSCIKAHDGEVCGLKWSNEGNLLASGGDDNLVYIWEPSKMSSPNFLHRFNDHRAAVKALAWCPYQLNVLASGGGTQDGCIKIWNLQKGTCISNIDTKSQASSEIINSFFLQVILRLKLSYVRLSHNFCNLMLTCADLWTGMEQASQRDTEWPWLQYKWGWKQIMLVEIPTDDQTRRVTASNLQNSGAFPGLTI